MRYNRHINYHIELEYRAVVEDRIITITKKWMKESGYHILIHNSKTYKHVSLRQIKTLKKAKQIVLDILEYVK